MDRREENEHIVEKREGEKEAYDTLINRVSQSISQQVSQPTSQCISKLVSQLITKVIVQQEFQSLRQTINSKNIHRHKL